MKSILVALDATPRAPEVLGAAVALARNTGSKLILLRAIGLPSEVPAEAFAIPPDGLINVLDERARRELAELSKGVPAEVPFEIEVQVGSAWQVICDVGRSLGAGLIVIGSHGYGGVDRVLGTNAARVVNHADRSVLVVRAPEILPIG
jgi:nucleotide-binding universal stress UspA family protein